MSNPPFPFDPEIPTLDPATVEDDMALGEAVDALVFHDLAARERMLEIFRYSEGLRTTLDKDTWKTFLRYDELANARFAELMLVTARWAFNEGRRHPVAASS